MQGFNPADLNLQAASSSKAGDRTHATAEEIAKQQEQKKAEEETRSQILKVALTPPAYERLQRIKLVKPQNAQRISLMIEQMFRMGRITSQISEDMFLDFLSTAEQKEQVDSKKIQIIRKYKEEDDDEIDDADFI